MIVSTTPTIEGQPVRKHHGLAVGESIIGANIVRDIFAGIRDIVGGRSQAYEKSIREAREIAVQEMVEHAQSLGANAVVGVDIDYEVIGEQGSMMMVSACGTAVTL